MLKPMMGPLSEFGSGWLGIAVWTPPSGGGEEWMGIRVWTEAGSENSDEPGIVVNVEVCVGPGDDEDDNESRWRFAKRRGWSWDVA